MKRIEIVKVQIVREKIMYYDGNKFISSPIDAVEIVRQYIGNEDREHFIVMMLSTKNAVNAIHTASIGSLNAAIVHPREVFKAAILSNAASIIVAHNHPSGSPVPSDEDIIVTDRIRETGKIIGIELLDSLVIGENGRYTSLKQQGLMQ